MTIRTTRLSSPFSVLLASVFIALLAGCATPPQPVASVSNEAMPFDQAIVTAADGLVTQIQQPSGFLGKAAKRELVLDPTLDAASGQQTAATQRLDRALAERIMSKSDQIAVLPFEAANLSKAQYLLTGTLTRAQGNYRLNIALVDVKRGVVAAQSSAVARPEGVDMSPLAYYRDSPVLLKDKVTDGYVRTSSTPPGQTADASYLERIASATVINDATNLYNAARYKEALGQYRSALAMPAGDQIRVLNGIYLSSAKLGLSAEAEEAFGRVVAYGIANKRLGVKFLFNPGSTEFWSDPKVSSAYSMWLRQIARQGGSARVCMDVVGHTSKTGTEAVNDTLSLKRAVFMKQKLSGEAPELGTRLRPQGMGSRENIVGSGSDDVVDALDRRVEFTITDCTR